MSCNRTKYLDQKAELSSRPLIAGALEGVDAVVVIPAFAERDHLFHTLDSLRANAPDDLTHTLVICVINNRREPLASSEQIANNHDTLSRLAPMIESALPLRLAYVDASSPGVELPDKGGVGLARKIGLDHGLAVLTAQDVRGALVCLDADTRVEPNYLTALRAHFKSSDAWAAVIDYAHDDAATDEETDAIVCYELFLRYHVIALAWARSPYAFPTIGSTIACSTDAYVAVAGMNQRQAGEDFYFLQQLAKTGPVRPIFDAVVHPSPRPSPRVPFGTGQRVRRYLARSHDEYRLYDPRSYQVLEQWLAAVSRSLNASAPELMAEAGRISPQLAQFLEDARFGSIWPGLQRNASTPEKLLDQFHRWFDGFKTIKLLHHLRDTTFPDAEMFSSIQEILNRLKAKNGDWLEFRQLETRACTHFSPPDWGGLPHDLAAQKSLLNHLRSLERALRE